MRKIIYSLIILAVFNNAFTQVPNYVPKKGLLGWWPFTGNALDSSGNGNNGAITGATLTTDRLGKTNQAYNFDGNDFIQITQKSNFNFDTNSYTISCWALKTGTNTFNTMICRHFVTAWPNAKTSFALRFEGVNGNGIATFGAGVDLNNNAVLTYTSGTINYTSWNHYVYVYNNAIKTVSLYINGTLVKTVSIKNPPISYSTTANLFFGVEEPFASMPSGPLYLTGKLDDIGIWNRALDPCEIAGLYQSKVVTPKPSSVSIGANTQSYCGKDSVKITATSGFKNYAWSNGKTGSSIFVKSTGTYTIAATDSQGCTVYDTAVISVLKPKISPRDTVACNANNVSLTVKNVNFSGNCGTMDAGLKSGMTAWYPFCGNANDLVGTNNGTVTGGATLTAGELNVPNTAYSFNGSSSYIGLSQPFLGGGQVSEFTLRSKVIFNSLTNNPNIWGKELFWGEINLEIWEGSLRLRWYNTVGGNNGSVIYTDTQKFKLKTNIWYDIVISFKNSKGIIYINGNTIATKHYWVAQSGTILSTTQVAASANFQQSSGSSRFGVRMTGGVWGNYLNGKIDEFNVWNRALSASEISKLYTQESTGSGKFNWSTSDTTATIKITQTGKSTVWVKVSNGIGSCYDTTSVRIQKPIVSIGKDTQSFCGVDSAKLTATSGFASYNWSNGKKGASVYANTTGPISVTATDSFGCNATDDALISVQNPRILPRDTIVCSGQAVALRVKDTTGGINACATLSGSLKSGLVGWWPFCGNANDESGNGNHASSYGGAALTTDRFGNKNGAYLFDGINDYLQGKFNNFPLGKEARSVAAWVKFNTKANLFENFLTSWGLGTASQSSAGQGFGVYVSMKLSFLELWPSFTPTPQNNLRHNYTFDSGKFYHIAFTMDSNSNFKFFINSKLVHTSSVIGLNTVSNNGIFRFGRSSHTNTDGWAGYMKGVIDEIGVWNREINNSEITSLFNNFSYNSGIEWSTGDTTSRTRIQTAGTTQVWLKQFNGIGTCYDTTTVRISNPVLNVAADTLRFTNCKRDSLRLSVGKKWKSVQWSHGPKDSAVFLNTTGKYSVRVQDSVGCFTADTFNFINPGRVQASITRTDSVKCFNGSTGSAAGAATGGFTPLQYKWSNGQAGTTATGLQQGNYAFIATDAFGCADTVFASVKQPSRTTLSIAKIDSITCYNFSNGRITTSGAGGTLPYQFRWQGGQTGNILSNLPSGVYRVYLTDKNGCKDSLNVTLSNPPEVIARIVSGNMTMKGQNMDVAAQVTPAGNYTYQWQPASVFGSNANRQNATIQLSNNTKLLLTATNAKGCVGKDSLEIGVLQLVKDIIPNAFSPNKDGLNEGFGLPDIFEIESFYVYDRWGGIIFKGNSSNPRWNGYIGSEPVPSGTYTYQITAKLKGGIQAINHTGKVTVVK